VAKRLLQALRQARPATARQFLALAGQHTVRYVLAVEPPESHAPAMPPRLEPEWRTPSFCGACGRRFPIPIVSVQDGDEDSPLVEQLLSTLPVAVKPNGCQEALNQDTTNAHP
jgi:hypothetical protein